MPRIGAHALLKIETGKNFMRRLLSLDFVWQFAGGFALGAVALFAVQPEAKAFSPAPTAISQQD